LSNKKFAFQNYFKKMIAIQLIYGIIGMKDHADGAGKMCKMHSKLPPAGRGGIDHRSRNAENTRTGRKGDCGDLWQPL
jgi:hypothetical protein